MIPLRKIQTKIHKMTVFSISETRRDRKNPASDSKSAPPNQPKTVKKPSDTCDKFFFVVQCNSFQFLNNFSLVFKITPKVRARPISFQHKLQHLVSHYFWCEMCDVICNLPIAY